MHVFGCIAQIGRGNHLVNPAWWLESTSPAYSPKSARGDCVCLKVRQGIAKHAHCVSPPTTHAVLTLHAGLVCYHLMSSTEQALQRWPPLSPGICAGGARGCQRLSLRPRAGRIWLCAAPARPSRRVPAPIAHSVSPHSSRTLCNTWTDALSGPCSALGVSANAGVAEGTLCAQRLLLSPCSGYETPC